jgi:hypothetical protein
MAGSSVIRQSKTILARFGELKKQITSLVATVKEQATQIENVSNQIQLNRPAPQLVNNEQ